MTFILPLNYQRRWLILLFVLFSGMSYSQKPSSETNAVAKPVWTQVWQNHNYSFDQLNNDFKDYWKDKPYQKGKAYKQYVRWENYVKPRIYPTGDLTLPSNNYINFMEWQKRQDLDYKSLDESWVELGPVGAPAGDDTGVGRVNMIRFDPNNANIFYIGTPNGGLWKSVDGGNSWTTMSDFLEILGASDLAIDPSDSNIMYLATGDIEGDTRSIGVLKSVDGGLNWNATGLSWLPSDNYRISKLLMHPDSSHILLAATDGGIFRTNDAGDSWTEPDDIVDFKDMEFNPGNPDIVYAAGTEFWKSEDNGISWVQITDGLPDSQDIARIALAVTEADTSIVYALIGNSTDNGFLGFYGSVDNGDSFSLLSDSPNVLGFETDGSDAGGQAFYDLSIAVAPDDADFITVGGINMWQSDDGGATWYIISHWNPDPSFEFVHADIHEINYLPGNNTTLFSCGDGGIYISDDDGVNWTDISSNLNISQQNRLGISSTTSGLYVAGLQDIGSIMYNGAWSVIGGGDGEDCLIDYSNDNNIIISGVNGYYELSTDGGATFQEISADLPTSGEEALFLSPISQDPVVPTRLYAGGRSSLYVSNDMGANWDELGAPFNDELIVEFEVAQADNSIIYALIADAFAVSTDGGLNWTDRSTGLPISNAALTNLAISDTDPDVVYVTFSGYSAFDKVYRTFDGGVNWENVSQGLPNLPVNTIVYQNGSANGDIYIGADVGVYHMNNLMSSWEPYFTNLARSQVRDLKIFYPDNKLRAATYGRGAWETDLIIEEEDNDNDGFVASEDCDDTNPEVNPDQTEIPYNGLDDDCDPATLDDDLDGDGFLVADDCDDTNAEVNSDQTEIPYNGLDDDCDPETLDDDLDGDGFLAADDCDDTNAEVNSDQTEIPYNGLDDDCDPATLDDDLDGDGFPAVDDCDDTNAEVNSDQTEIPYNGLDDDCDPATLDDDFDGDGYDLADDCDDTNAEVNPDQTEIPYNGLDDDCDPATLDDDLDGDGFLAADDCDDTNAEVNSNQTEIPYNGLDDDCDPATLDDDLDGDGFLAADDCDDTNAEVNPDQTEIPYNGLDDDCDPATLDDDLDGDGFLAADDCDDTNAEVNSDQTEIPYNGLDDDCDPATLDDDLDGDGFLAADDCDDTNAEVNSDQTEIPYNGLDDDCDPATLDDDFDGDGYDLADDCDDTNAEVNPGQTEIPYNGIDDDCDPLTADDDADGDGFAVTEDCDDTNAEVNPGQSEIPYNGLDDDCDPSTVDDDLDGDGFLAADDCDDTNAEVNPDQTEIPYNGLDDDCDPATLDDDFDGDSYNLADDCDDTNAEVNPGQTEIPYNGIDDDCDPSTADDDADGDGFAVTEDCDDTNAEVNPDQTEIPYNGLDDDCDPATLDDDLDGDGFLAAEDCDDTNAEVNSDQTEIPYNGLDDDCDPATLDDDLDGDGFLAANDCDDTNAEVNPDQTEIPYNGLDDDCDPATLDDDLDGDGFLAADDCDDTNAEVNSNQTEIPYNGLDDDCDPATLDDDLDGDGFLAADDCDDSNAEVNPAQPEIPYNGVDDDCDAATLDDDLDSDGFLLADDCDDTDAGINPDAVEIPNNGIDEDCDGSDLMTSVFEIGNSVINVYPNPTSGIVRIDKDSNVDLTISLFDLSGKLLFKDLKTNVIDLSDFNNGVYMLKIFHEASNKSVVEKLILSR